MHLAANDADETALRLQTVLTTSSEDELSKRAADILKIGLSILMPLAAPHPIPRSCPAGVRRIC